MARIENDVSPDSLAVGERQYDEGDDEKEGRKLDYHKG